MMTARQLFPQPPPPGRSLSRPELLPDLPEGRGGLEPAAAIASGGHLFPQARPMPKQKRGPRPAAPGESRVKRKYTKRKHLLQPQQSLLAQLAVANGSALPRPDGVAKPKWKGGKERLNNELGKVAQKRRRRKEKLSVRCEAAALVPPGSVPGGWRVKEEHPPPASPTKLSGPQLKPTLAQSSQPMSTGPEAALRQSPPKQRKMSGVGTADGVKTEATPLFEHIDEDWAVIKKSLEKTTSAKTVKIVPKNEPKPPSTPSPVKSEKSVERSPDSDDRDLLIDTSSDDDFGNDVNAPMHNLEKLQEQMIQNLMDAGAMAALKKKRLAQKATFIKKRKDMSDYWKNKLVGMKGAPFPTRVKRPYTVRPLTSENMKHMEEAIASVLADTAGDDDTSCVPNDVPTAPAPPVVPKLKLKKQREVQLSAAPRYAVTATPSKAPPLEQLAPAPPTQRSADASGAAAATAAHAAPEQPAPARLKQLKAELSARFVSDLIEQQQAEASLAYSAQLQMAAQQQGFAWPPPGVPDAGCAPPEPTRLLVRVRHRRRRDGRPPRLVRMSGLAYSAGAMLSDVPLADDDEGDGELPPPADDSPPPRTMPTAKLKGFLDTARVSRYRRVCSSGLLASVECTPDLTDQRIVLVSRTPLPESARLSRVGGDAGTAGSWTPGASAGGHPAAVCGRLPDWQSPELPLWPAGSEWLGMSPTSRPVQVSPAGVSGMASPPLAGWQVRCPASAASPSGAFVSTAPLSVMAPVSEQVAPVRAGDQRSANISPVSRTDGSVSPAASEQRGRPPPSSGAPSRAGSEAPSAPMSPRMTPVSPRQASMSPRQTPLSPRQMSTSPRQISTSLRQTSVSPGSASGAATPAAGALSATASKQTSPQPLPFVCNCCPAQLASLSEQLYHEIRQHMITGRQFRCMGCAMSLVMSIDPAAEVDGLIEHYLRHMDDEGRLKGVDLYATQWTCGLCRRKFDDPANYGAHEVRCRSLTLSCRFCGAKFESSDQVKWHEVEHLRGPDGKYACDQCDSKFPKREQILGHRRFHFKVKNVECPKCGKKFMTTGMLAMHNKWKHSQGPCRFCGRPFTSATARQAHEEHMHLKHMMHMCDVCHFRVMSASQLRVHKRSHTAETPHKCAECDQAFFSRNLLRKHKLKHGATAAAGTEPKEGSPVRSGSSLTPATPELKKSPLPHSAGEGTPRPDGSSLTPAELRQLFERYKATWTGPSDSLTLSDLETSSDEEEKRDQEDIQAKEELYKTKDKNSFSIWSCPVCNAFFTKLWGVRAHITLKHPGASVRPVLHDDKGTSALSKQEFLKEIKRNAKTAKRELKLEAKRQARIAAYGDDLPRRGRPRKNPLEDRKPRPPVDPNAPRKRGRPRKADSVTASPAAGSAWSSPIVGSSPDGVSAEPQPAGSGVPPGTSPAGRLPTPPPPAPVQPQPPPNCVEKRRWKCLSCGDLSGSYEDLVTHTYIAHPDADLPRFEVVVTYVPKPAWSARAREDSVGSGDFPVDGAASGGTAETQEDHDAALLDSARVRGAEKRRAPSTTKVPEGVKRRKMPPANGSVGKTHSAAKVASSTPRSNSSHTKASASIGKHKLTAAKVIPSARQPATGVKKQSFVPAKTSAGDARVTANGIKSSGRAARNKSSAEGDSYKKKYVNSSRRYREEAAEQADGAANASTELYCYCRSPYDEVSEMIGCDSDTCKHEWFHFECVGIVIAPKGKWFCPDCTATNKKKSAK